MSSRPEYHSHEEFQNRSQKLSELRNLGLEPYPHKYSPSHKASDLLKDFESIETGTSDAATEGSTPEVTVSGRMVLFRGMGKNAFAHLQDSEGRVQVMFNRDLSKVVGYDPEACGVEGAPSHFKLIEKRFDLGDFVGVKGHVFRTNKGELTILAKEVTLLCKSLLPLADKHGGLSDMETRYRKRWLDLTSNRDVVETFQKRTNILLAIREYMEGHAFQEVETPVLQAVYGGANAKPFCTVHNALEQEMFLRISLELPLKKLIVGGLERVYEMGKVFRNESIDRTHNPEFTELEAYAAYWDYNDMMAFTEGLYEHVALKLFGKTTFPFTKDGGETIEIDVKTPWKRMTMKESIRVYGGVDVDALSDKELLERLLACSGVEEDKVKGLPRGLLISELFEELVEEKLIQPHHITDHPIETTMLCKPHRDPKEREAGIVERFESFIIGSEMCNAYSELNDPEIQRNLLEDQASKRQAGDEEACPLDEEFIESICQGLPPTGGVGMGVDRMIMLFLNQPSIRDVLFFPFMRTQTAAVATS